MWKEVSVRANDIVILQDNESDDEVQETVEQLLGQLQTG
jgi:hypothetical protein